MNECAVCGARTTLACDRCKSVFYCSSKHQTADWERHKRWCDERVAVGVQVPEAQRSCMKPDSIWGAARTIPLTDPSHKMAMGFVKDKDLGEGTYALVSLRHPKGRPAVDVAFKEMKMPDGVPTASVLREMEVRNLDHPNVVGICMAGFMPQQDGFKAAVVMDAASMTLSQLIQKAKAEDKFMPVGPFDPTEARMLSFQLVSGVAECHAQLIINGDIKPQNVLIYGRTQPAVPAKPRLGNFKQLVVADFGLAMGFYVWPYNRAALFSLRYRPPEHFVDEKNQVVSDRSDVWATGCCLFEIATGATLFKGDTEDETLAKIIDAAEGPKPRWWKGEWKAPGGNFKKHVADKVEPELASLLRKMLATDPKARCSIFDALDSPYFTEAAKKRVTEVLGDHPIRRLKYTLDNPLEVSTGSVLTVLREKVRQEQLTAGSCDPPGGCLAAMRCATANFFKHLVLQLCNVEAALMALVLLRAYVFQRCELEEDGGCGEEGGRREGKRAGYDLTSHVCQLLACRYRLSSYGYRAENFARLFNLEGNAMECRARTVLKYLDFNLSRVCGFDFIRQFARINDFSHEMANRACVLMLLRNVMLRVPQYYSLEAEAAICLGAATGSLMMQTDEGPGHALGISSDLVKETVSAAKKALDTPALKKLQEPDARTSMSLVARFEWIRNLPE